MSNIQWHFPWSTKRSTWRVAACQLSMPTNSWSPSQSISERCIFCPSSFYCQSEEYNTWVDVHLQKCGSCSETTSESVGGETRSCGCSSHSCTSWDASGIVKMKNSGPIWVKGKEHRKPTSHHSWEILKTGICSYWESLHSPWAELK